MTNGYCSVCNKSKNDIISHHISYYPEEIIKICRSCHQLIHQTETYPELCPSDEDIRKFYLEKDLNFGVNIFRSFRNIMLNSIQFKLVDILQKEGDLTRSEFVSLLNIPRTTIYDNLVRLINLNIVKKSFVNRSKHCYVMFELTNKTL